MEGEGKEGRRGRGGGKGMKGGKLENHIFSTLASISAGVKHSDIVCGWCSSQYIAGILWKCVQCLKYYLCSSCYHNNKHTLEHEFDRINGVHMDQWFVCYVDLVMHTQMYL